MIEINLTLFPGSQFHDVYKFVMEKTEFKFCVIVPKAINEHAADVYFCRSVDYGMAAYAGQQLAIVATDFNYFVPSAESNCPFRFELEVTEPALFADVLYRLLCAYNTAFNCNDRRFEYEASQFYLHAYQNELQPHTWGLLDIANQNLALAGKQFNKK